MHNSSATVFRVDKFIVPAPVLGAFVDQMQQIQRTLRNLPGCLRATVLTQTGGAGEFNALTVVEWENDEAVAAAQQIVQKKFTEEGFDPKTFVQSLGARSDLGLYRNA